MEGWIIISKGLNVPMDYEECDEEHFEAFPRNSKAMNMLYCAMKEEFFKNISICSMAKEIWKKLEQMYGERRKRKLNKHNAQQVKCNL